MCCWTSRSRARSRWSGSGPRRCASTWLLPAGRSWSGGSSAGAPRIWRRWDPVWPEAGRNLQPPRILTTLSSTIPWITPWTRYGPLWAPNTAARTNGSRWSTSEEAGGGRKPPLCEKNCRDLVIWIRDGTDTRRDAFIRAFRTMRGERRWYLAKSVFWPIMWCVSRTFTRVCWTSTTAAMMRCIRRSSRRRPCWRSIMTASRETVPVRICASRLPSMILTKNTKE